MPSIQEIEAAVFRAVDAVNSLLPADKRLAKSAGVALTGDDSVVDSLGLVNLIVAVEQAVADDLGVSISLINEDSMSREVSPFATLGSLTRYALELAVRD